MNNEKSRFDKVANSWDESPGRVKLASDIAAAIVNTGILNPNMNVLDFGCGTGLVTLSLAPLVHSITGVDSSSSMLEIVDKKIKSQNICNVRTQHLDVEKGDVLDGAYDLIVCSMTLHHIRDFKALLEQFYNISSSGAYLCIADLDPDDGQFHGDNDGVIHFGFNREAILLVLQELKFNNIDVRTATEVNRAVPGGGSRLFSIFLITVRKS